MSMEVNLTLNTKTGEAILTGPGGINRFVSKEEIAEEIKNYSYILKDKQGKFNFNNAWYISDYSIILAERDGLKLKKTSKDLNPFIDKKAIEYFKLDINIHPRSFSKNATKQIRALIRQKLKLKKTIKDELEALYRCLILDDFMDSINDRRLGLDQAILFIDKNEITCIDINYSNIGYKQLKSALPTDIKWLKDFFGEPTSHLGVESIFNKIKKNAISRFCWHDLMSQNRARSNLGKKILSIKEWMEWWFGMYLGYYNEWKDRVSSDNNPIKVNSSTAALKILESTFVVADLETTGLNSGVNEIIEFAAVISDPAGEILDEFSILVKPKEQIPEFITNLTGITQKDVDKNGTSQKDALNKFLKFIKNYPVFFHNAHFDISFINAACKEHAFEFKNEVYDSLAFARRQWPGLPSYKLIELTKIVGVKEPTHRALDDTKATLAVILGCRDKPVSTVNISIKETEIHHKFTTKDFVANSNGKFFGKTIVFTGSLVAMTRDGAAQHASKYGFKIGASVTSKTDYLVVGTQDLSHLAGHEKSSKHRKAEDLAKDGISIQIITEQDFLEIIES